MCSKFLLAVMMVGCGRESNDKREPVVFATPPDTCLTMAVFGQFPEGGVTRQTWFYGCQEGFEMWEGRRLFLADSACKNGETVSNAEFPFLKVASVSCPTEGKTFSCVGDTWRIYGYKQPPQDLFSLDTFKATCTAKGGVFQQG